MRPRGEAVAAALVALAGASALVVTALSQHPNRTFDRLRSLDKVGFAIPNWRFFAPEPAMNDFHVLHRILTLDEVETEWEETHSVTPRRVTHLLWFPDRRRDKGLFDVASALVTQLGQDDRDILASTAYRLLSSFVRHRIVESGIGPIEGFQFMLASSTGCDESTPPSEILVSPFIPWGENQ